MKNLTNFIKRNLPIFIIGLLTMFAFVGIILLSERNNNQEPALKIVNQDELVAEHNYFKGPEDGKVVLVEFSDFQCPACALFAPLVTGFEFKFPNLKIVYRHYPLPQHSQGKPAAYAVMAAGEQDAFWEYHDKLFENQNQLSEDLYVQIAKDLGLDEDQFKKDMASERIMQYVEADLNAGRAMGVNSTPTFFLNGRQLELKDIGDLEKAIIDEFNKQKQPTGATTQPELTDKEMEERSRKAAAIDYGDTLDKPTFPIKYTTEGFNPYEATIRQGQTIVWTNDTENEITIVPRFGYEDVYPNAKNGIKIPPKGQGELELFKADRWVYVVKETGDSGYVYPLKIDGPIIPKTDESTPSEN
jgi:protein-disulfide isomerase